MSDTIIEISLFGLGGLFTVLWYLLQQKDAKQQKDIELLWTKHDMDVDKLRELELHIAQQHYVKAELDAKFDKMDSTMRSGFGALNEKFDALTQAIIKRNE